MDTRTVEQRSKNMSVIPHENTKLEILVAKYLFAHGFRYRKNVKTLPGKPDIVLKKYRTVIFINGCFWHGHEGCSKAHLPKSNIEFWANKIDYNRRRDAEEYDKLCEMGWNVITVWGCELSKNLFNETMDTVVSRINNNLKQSDK
ncbi:MAG: DNA mismatch endonuclease Vsr [Clostridiales bacterium]|nr:DNA mismatch endonuclease Vsr [Clostridiales bacterium]